MSETGRKSSTLSVLIPNYNHGKFITEAVSAILNQSHRPDEIVIGDDASTDNSLEIIEEIASCTSIVRIIKNKKRLGVIGNITHLINSVQTRYIYLASADDMILPGLFEKSMNMLEKHPEAGLCTSLSITVDENGKNTGIYPSPVISFFCRHIPPREAVRYLRRYGSWMLGNTAVYRREAFLDAGGYIEGLGAFCDGYIHRVIALEHGACFIPEALSVWRILSTGLAKSSKNDIRVWLGYKLKATELMRTTHRELFPSDLTDYWERAQIYRAGLIAAKRRDINSWKFVQKALESSCRSPTWTDDLFRVVAKIFSRFAW